MSLAVGDTAQIRAVLFDDDGGSIVVTTQATWQSENTAIAAVDGAGIVTARAAGTTNVTVAVDEDNRAVVALTVRQSSDGSTTFSGVLAAADGHTGLLTVSISPAFGATGTAHLGSRAVNVVGHLDAVTGILHVAGSDLTFLGVRAGNVIAGAFTDGNGATGGFSMVDSTHVALTPFCGSYTSDGVTGLGNADAGAFALAFSTDGTVAGASLPRDASSTALKFVGQRSGQAFVIGGAQAQGTGTIENAVASGGFTTASGSTATFTVSAANCS